MVFLHWMEVLIMPAFDYLGTITIPPITHPVDGKSFILAKVRSGELYRSEQFRLGVESGFGRAAKTLPSSVRRWQLSQSLSFQEVERQLSGSNAPVEWWEFMYLLFPLDEHGNRMPSHLRIPPATHLFMRGADQPLSGPSLIRAGPQPKSSHCLSAQVVDCGTLLAGAMFILK